MIARRAALVLLGAALAGTVPAGARADRPVAVSARPVALNPLQPRQERAGDLRYRGGLALAAPDPRFGGFSGLAVSPDGRWLTAVSDRGAWLRARIVHGADGRLAGLAGGRIGPLRDPAGQPLRGRGADAEALAVLPDGSMLVAFERRHRILRYPAGPDSLAGRPSVWPAPAGLARAPGNRGAEALAAIGGGALLLLTEGLRAGPGAFAGWSGRKGRWQPLAYARSGDFRPTDAAALPDGAIAVLERRYRLADGPAVRIALVPRRALVPGAAVPGSVLRGREILRLARPLTVDNFEALAARRGPDGRTLLYLLSDDNFNPLQRTLLLLFELP